jgi:DNA-binding response OmpR family regulator
VSNQKILIVDDDKKIVELVTLYLKKDGYQVLAAFDGQQALDLVERKQPDLVILDLGLPQVDGMDVCRLLRMRAARTPIIMLTARTTEDDKLAGLDVGADDYVTKPFSPRELMARIRAVLRRAGDHAAGPAEIRFGANVIDLVRHEVRRDSQVVNLTPTEFRLLEVMSQAPGRAFKRLDLVELVCGYDYEGLERTIDVHIMNLRKKIEPEPSAPRYIVTVPGLGYRFEGVDEN